jgi:hypothetical protein
VVSKRFGYKEGAIELYAERVPFRGLSAVAQAEGLRQKLLTGLALRRFVALRSFSFLIAAFVLRLFSASFLFSWFYFAISVLVADCVERATVCCAW